MSTRWWRERPAQWRVVGVRQASKPRSKPVRAAMLRVGAMRLEDPAAHHRREPDAGEPHQKSSAAPRLLFEDATLRWSEDSASSSRGRTAFDAMTIQSKVAGQDANVRRCHVVGRRRRLLRLAEPRADQSLRCNQRHAGAATEGSQRYGAEPSAHASARAHCVRRRRGSCHWAPLIEQKLRTMPASVWPSDLQIKQPPGGSRLSAKRRPPSASRSDAIRAGAQQLRRLIYTATNPCWVILELAQRYQTDPRVCDLCVACSTGALDPDERGRARLRRRTQLHH